MNRLIKSDDHYLQRQAKLSKMLDELVLRGEYPRAVFVAVMSEDYQRGMELLSQHCGMIPGAPVVLNLISRIKSVKQSAGSKPKKASAFEYTSLNSFSRSEELSSEMLLGCEFP